MSDISAVIIEDEIPAARRLHSLVKRLRPQWDVKTLPGSVEECMEWFASNEHPDLMFLDIRLSDGTSFDLLSEIRPESAVIFTTAYDEYAVRAFTVNSIDYILKPIDELRLEEAISKFENLTLLHRPDNYMSMLLDALKSRDKRYRSRFLISSTDRSYTLQVEDVAYFYSESKTTTAVTHDGKFHVVDLALNRLEDELDPDMFFRANRQLLVSVRAIERIEPYFNGKISITLVPAYKETITVSAEKATAFKVWLNY